MGWSLYLPQERCDDDERRRAKIPDDVGFQTKPDLAQALIADAAGWDVPRGPVLADSAYGDDGDFRVRLEDEQLSYVVAVSATLSVYDNDTEFTGPGTGERDRSAGERRPRGSRALLAWRARREAARGRVRDARLRQVCRGRIRARAVSRAADVRRERHPPLARSAPPTMPSRFRQGPGSASGSTPRHSSGRSAGSRSTARSRRSAWAKTAAIAGFHDSSGEIAVAQVLDAIHYLLGRLDSSCFPGLREFGGLGHVCIDTGTIVRAAPDLVELCAIP